MPFASSGSGISSSAQIVDGIITGADLLDGTIMNADVNASAGIVYSKLNLSASIVNGDLAVGIGITEAQQTLANNTTNDVSTSKHGYAPILPNDVTKFFNGIGGYSVPPAATKVYISTTQQVITATSETTIYSFTLPANTLGTNGAIMGRLFFSFTNADLAGKTLNVKYGGTTIATFSGTPNANTGMTFKGYIDFIIAAAGTTNSQKGSVYVDGVTGYIATAGSGGQMSGGGNGTAAIDSTADQTVLLSWNNGGGTTNFTAEHIIVYKVI